MTEAEFKTQLQQKTAEIEALLPKYLPAADGTVYPPVIAEAMNYSVLAGGKRLRPILMRETYRLCGGGGNWAMDTALDAFCAALEMIHTYSLVHDDLPAMDNDEYRRGRKTTWAVYGDAMGVLAGDGLLNYAYETAMKAFDSCDKRGDICNVALALQILADRAGIRGMIGGQTADIEAEQKETLTEEEILYIHTHKTGALIEAAMRIGAVLAGAEQSVLEKISVYALDIGVAFQIQDDILDVVGDSAELGKPVGSDEASGKQTYVTLHGIEASRAEVARLSGEAIGILRELPGDSAFLETLTGYLINRRK